LGVLLKAGLTLAPACARVNFFGTVFRYAEQVARDELTSSRATAECIDKTTSGETLREVRVKYGKPIRMKDASTKFLSKGNLQARATGRARHFLIGTFSLDQQR
jgi:hypothetical protein